MLIDGGRVVIRSKPFIGSELDQLTGNEWMEGLKFTTAGGSLQLAKVVQPPKPFAI